MIYMLGFLQWPRSSPEEHMAELVIYSLSDMDYRVFTKQWVLEMAGIEEWHMKLGLGGS